MKAAAHRLTAALALAVLASAAHATNGLYLTAYGAEAQGRGGANIAISDRTLGLNANPAGISQLQGNHYTASLAILAPSLEFENMVNAPTDAENRTFPLPAFAWVRGGKESRWAYGVGCIAQGGAETLDFEGLVLDVAGHRVRVGERTVALGPTEYRMLEFFMTHPERVYSREQLLDRIWGGNVYVEERTIDVHIRRLRKALEEFGYDRLIQTVRGAGYRFSTRLE